jgi:phosphatidylglycerol:prolipoprotein diacylglycerol transferase
VTFRSSWSARELGTPIDEPLHPTQIYESLAVLAIFFLLVWLAPRKRFHGQLAAIYVIAYAIARFTIELWRGDARGSLLGGALSTSQALAIVAVIAAGALLPYLIRRQRVVS